MIHLFLLFIISALLNAQDLKSERIRWILEAFNSNPDQLIEPLTIDQIELGDYEGRVMVNKKAKFSYFIHIEDKEDPKSKMVLIPMATSRFAPNYYQTDEWWEKYKDQKPMPKQNPDEVLAWLNEMKLSTNPDVILIIDPVNKRTERTTLKEYLLHLYLENYVENGKVVLYRGAEKPGELESWKKGEMPRGVRYWTPTANYAWRYARKNKEFLDLLIKNETPLFRFEIPVAVFKDMVLRRWPRLTLGTELTKNAHSIFNSDQYFGDHLYASQPYLGVGHLGVEFEVRSNRSGAMQMVQYFVRPATVDDLVKDRMQVLNKAKLRLLKQKGSSSSAGIDKRLEALKIENQILKAIVDRKVDPQMETLLVQMSSQKAELGYIDNVQFTDWARKTCRDVLNAK